MIAAVGTGLTADAFTIEYDPGVIDLLESTFVAELRKPAIHRAPRRKIARQQPPWTARSHHIENAIDDLAHGPATRPSRATCHRQVRLNHAPFLIRHIRLVSRRIANMLLAAGWGPHGNSGVLSALPWNHVDANYSNPFPVASIYTNPVQARRRQLFAMVERGLLLEMPTVIATAAGADCRDLRRGLPWRTPPERS